MLSAFSWIIRPICGRSGRTASCLIAFLTALFLLCPTGAHADTYQITFINVIFTATCIGGGTCTEVINGSGLYDPASDTAWDISIQMTGTLNASLDSYGTPTCTAPGCLSGSGVTGSRVLYDPNASPGFNPIEFNPNLGNQFDAPTPQALTGGPNGTLLFVPNMCGGDQPACNTTGAFPGNSATPYQLTSGTYTSVDIGPSPVPEPATVLQIISGLLPIAGLTVRKRPRH